MIGFTAEPLHDGLNKHLTTDRVTYEQAHSNFPLQLMPTQMEFGQMCVWVCQSVCVCVCVWSNLIWTTGRHRNPTAEASFDVIYGTTEGHLLVGCLRSEGN